MQSLQLVLAVVATGALIWYGLRAFDRLVRMHREQPRGGDAAAGVASRPAAEPDPPRAFGEDHAWFAVRSSDPAAVAAALRLRTLLPANWRAGLAAVKSEGVFVTPSIDGFVLVVGRDACPAMGNLPEFVQQWLERLSQRFGEAQWYRSERACDQHGWAVAHHGVLSRAWCWDGEEDEVTWQHGEPTRAEAGLGFFVDDPRDRSDAVHKWWPDGASVRRLAAAWSLAPHELGCRGLPPSRGAIGRL